MKNDYQIQEDVMTELKWQPFLTPANIGVAVKDGIVTLSGNVENYFQKKAAERAAKKVAGVKAIAEDIQIGVSPINQKTDADIAQSVASALLWHSAVPNGNVTPRVENGTVTLEGEVDWDFQRDSAKNAIGNLVGVRNVVNLISVKPKAMADDVSTKIKAALHRAATVDGAKIHVETVGGTVKLNGVVRSYAEKEDAEEAAWCAPGVTKVENNLYVEPQLELSF